MWNLFNGESDSLSKCAKDAYKTALSHRHPWTIRQAAKLAFVAIRTSRDDFYKYNRFDPPKCKEIAQIIANVKKDLWEFYKKHGYDKLP